MLRIPISQIILKIKKETGLSEEQIKNRIAAKVKELNGLVSEEGAAYIIAHELNVDLIAQQPTGELKIADLLIGMRRFIITGKVLRVFPPRSFEKDGKTNHVGSFIIGDESGKIRVVVWDKRVEWLVNGQIKEGMVIKIKNGYVRGNKTWGKEIHLNLRSQVVLDVEEEVNVKEEVVKEAKIEEISVGETVRLIGTVVSTFSPHFYEICPNCGRRMVSTEDGELVCEEHGKVEPKTEMVFSFVLDDGTGAIRCVAFGETVENLLGFSVREAQELSDNEVLLKERIDEAILGEVLEVEGRVRNNPAFERIEVIVNKTLKPNPTLIIKKLIKEINR